MAPWGDPHDSDPSMLGVQNFQNHQSVSHVEPSATQGLAALKILHQSTHKAGEDQALLVILIRGLVGNLPMISPTILALLPYLRGNLRGSNYRGR